MYETWFNSIIKGTIILNPRISLNKQKKPIGIISSSFLHNISIAYIEFCFFFITAVFHIKKIIR